MNIDNAGVSFNYLVKIVNAEDAAYLTDSAETILYATNLYSPVQGMEVSLSDSSGDLSDTEGEIKLPLEAANMLTRLTDGKASAVTTITVYGIYDEDIAEVYAFDFGYLYQAIRNPKGKIGIVSLVYKELKNYVDKPAGISCNAQCMRVFGDAGCTIAPVTQDVAVTAVSGNSVEIDTTISDPSNYNRGKLKYKGMALTIKSSSATLLTLVQSPPATMAGKTVEIEEGCDKTLETCIDRFDNEINFFGCGYDMVAYSPLTEMPDA